MTPTPRTDAAEWHTRTPGDPLGSDVVHSSFARQLECELEEAKADLKEQLETYNDQQSQLEQARRELMDLRNPVICQGCGHAVPIIHRTTPLGTDPANWRCDICIQWTVEKDLLHAQLTAHKAALEKARVALRPLAKIADAWNDDGLDESRPYWGHTKENAASIEIVSGRGGKQLLTIGDSFIADEALTAINELNKLQQPTLL